MPTYDSSMFKSLLEKETTTNPVLKKISEIYGQDVFDKKAMALKLSSQDIQALTQIFENGGKIESSLSERFALAVSEWAMEKGATHFCHWFQPQTGTTAEKHDAFLRFDDAGFPIEKLSPQDLLQSEPDASSFPSGGMRSTFEARGYTGWDPSSPMFILGSDSGKTLYIPSVFLSYHGEALDYKIPLLRSIKALNAEAVKTLNLLGEKNISKIVVNLGPEQEFFLVDKKAIEQRLDLKFCGRALFGNMPPKGQEMEDHYWATIPTRVQALINEMEHVLYGLGIPIKTRHNEVAPSQFEVAPIYEEANIACDHNQIIMSCLEKLAPKYNLALLLHEKPFDGVNGSGKHVNWSIADNLGRNVFEPGKNPEKNYIFLSFLSAVLLGIKKHEKIIRASIATAGNDHRLGANEAPPAIVSVFLGTMLDNLLNAIEAGETAQSLSRLKIDLELLSLQELKKDSTDRNRTSPFAFTGNKFEFRAVGSSATISYPVTILNAAVCDGLKTLNARLESCLTSQCSLQPETILDVIRVIIKETKDIRFEGNGYSEEWKQEATEIRKLSNAPHTPVALKVFKDEKLYAFLDELNILNKKDLSSRHEIQCERYVKQRMIEMNCALEMTKTQVLPCSIEHLNVLLETVKNLSVTEFKNNYVVKMAQEFNDSVSALGTALQSFENSCSKVKLIMDEHCWENAADMIVDDTLIKLQNLKIEIEKLEKITPDEKWPLMKFSEILFGLN